MKNKGFTLMEVIFATALVGILLIIVLAIIPMSVMDYKKIKDYQNINNYCRTLIEEVRNNKPQCADYPARDLDCRKVIDGTTFYIKRDIYAIDNCEPHKYFNVILTVNWPGHYPPLNISDYITFSE